MDTQTIKMIATLKKLNWEWDAWMPGKLVAEHGSINLNFKGKALIIVGDIENLLSVNKLCDALLAIPAPPRKIIQSKVVNQEFMPAYVAVEYSDKDAEIFFYLPDKHNIKDDEFVGMTEAEGRQHYMNKLT